MTFSQWASANPEKASIIVSLVVGVVIGVVGNLIANNVDGEKHPRLWQFGKMLQNLGIAIPKAGERFAGVLQGTKPSETPKPISPDSKTLVVGFVLLAGGLLTNVACGGGAKACAVVDVAHERCKVVRYLAPDGSAEELTADDLANVAAAKKAARAQQAQVTP